MVRSGMLSKARRASTLNDLWLGDVGIRVKDLKESLRFYTEVIGLKEIARGGDDQGIYVLLKDPRSGQRLELNWYGEGNAFATRYTLGEALDHMEVRVRSVPEVMKRLKAHGIKPATKKLWVNRRVVRKLQKDPAAMKLMKQDIWVTKTGHRIVYIQDPNGIFLCLYDHPEEPWEGPIPDGY